MSPVVWTIGHSTRSMPEFLELLSLHRVELVADVRRYPGSRRWPHFAQPELERALKTAGLDYRWMPALGGRRRASVDSPNTAWRSAMFRGYADYMATEPFDEALADLVSAACGLRTCIMCAEAVWWRCHRGLIADVLKWRGFRVCHILTRTGTEEHPYTPAAQVSRDGLSYAGRPQ